jgi:WD40-like Beta Propeller Repeat
VGSRRECFVDRHILLILPVTLGAGRTTGAPVPKAKEEPAQFLVRDLVEEKTGAGLPFKRVRLALLGPDGKEVELIEPPVLGGSLSPNGQWLASMEFDGDLGRMNLFMRPRHGKGEPVNIPLKWDVPAQSGTATIWSADSKRLLVGENRAAERGGLDFEYRIHDVAAGKATDLSVTEGHWVTSWSADGKSFITTFWGADNSARVARVAADGSGKAEFLTPEDEVASDAKLSPDGTKMAYMAGPKAPKGKRAEVRLTVMDLATKARVVVDEPGHTYGHCWSPSGSRLAYTWQRALDKTADNEQETLLITCDPNGKDRDATVTEATPGWDGGDLLLLGR